MGVGLIELTDSSVRFNSFALGELRVWGTAEGKGLERREGEGEIAKGGLR